LLLVMMPSLHCWPASPSCSCSRLHSDCSCCVRGPFRDPLLFAPPVCRRLHFAQPVGHRSKPSKHLRLRSCMCRCARPVLALSPCKEG
jgi:hypothetical protein